MLVSWEELPTTLKIPEIRTYYDILRKKRSSLFAKRLFDILFSLILIILLFPVMFIIAILIKFDSEGPVIYRQMRITKYDREFFILKFRTMIVNADQIGTLISLKCDPRITKIGRSLRKYRLDEFPQLFNVLKGEMSFVGTRPEVRKYVDIYDPEMKATLLMPAGVTSLASIEFRDEHTLFLNYTDVEQQYVEKVLPDKMKYNLKYIRDFSLVNDLKIIFKTLFLVVFSKG